MTKAQKVAESAARASTDELQDLRSRIAAMKVLEGQAAKIVRDHLKRNEATTIMGEFASATLVESLVCSVDIKKLRKLVDDATFMKIVSPSTEKVRKAIGDAKTERISKLTKRTALVTSLIDVE
jgi:predicted nucleotidyltransferase